MSDYSKKTDYELNEAIAVKKGWVRSEERIAREWGEKEKEYRGGKYEPEIIRFCIDSPTDFLEVKHA